MWVPPFGTALGVVPLLSIGQVQVAAFVLPTSSLSAGSPCSPSLAYGPRDDNDEEKASYLASDFLPKTEEAVDPTCPVDDEDCLAFSSLDRSQRLAFPSDANEDPLCDPQDVDCQAFLPKTYLKSDTNLAAELVTRSHSIEEERLDRHWRTAHCPTTFVQVVDDDWVRRVHMEQYPIAVCGGAHGGLYVVDLEEKTTIAKVENAHAIQVDKNDAIKRQAMEKLYGKLDGGGVLAVAIHGDLIASAGREGGVGLWWLVKSPQQKEGTIVPLGSVPGLEKTIVTSLKFDSNNLLWAGCYDGTVRAYSITGYDEGLAAQFPGKFPQQVFQSDFTDSVLDMHLCEELQLGVCATADGGAALFSMEDGQFFVGLMLFEGIAARSALVVKHKNEAGYSVLCGGADGTIHRIPLNVDPKTKRVDEENPFIVSDSTETAIKPKHTGPVMCLASGWDGTFVSGGQDGALRVWDCSVARSEKKSTLLTKCLYALTGYKLWLGSACTDGKRLISDGGENSIVVRDFSREPGTNGKASL